MGSNAPYSRHGLAAKFPIAYYSLLLAELFRLSNQPGNFKIKTRLLKDNIKVHQVQILHLKICKQLQVTPPPPHCCFLSLPWKLLSKLVTVMGTDYICGPH